jgi:uncharacterized protein (TIGR00255 family)
MSEAAPPGQAVAVAPERCDPAPAAAGRPGSGIASMTGFAQRGGAGHGHAWTWEARSVNGRGLEIRVRLPEGHDGLEPLARAALQARLRRGSVTLGLRLERSAGAGSAGLDPAALERALAQIAAVEAAARAAGVSLRPTSAAEILRLGGVGPTAGAADRTADAEPLRAALVADLEALIDALAERRAAEGGALAALLAGQLDRIGTLARAAAAEAEARAPARAEALPQALGRVMAGAAEADPARVAQELALIAVRADMTEEIDRLGAHVAAARALLAEGGAVGRRLDFLARELNREANTLLSKSGHGGLTRIGLDLKAAIDQFREQVQNVE